jgi:hypothetical protein
MSIIFLFNSCSKEKTFDCIKSTGKIVKEDQYFDNFSILYVNDNINVILVQNLPGKITIEAGDNLLPKIKTEQNGNTITISNKNTCNWVRSYDKPMNVYVGVNQIKKITQEGYGKISEGEYIKTDTLRIANLTYGDTDLSVDANFVGFVAEDHSTFRLSGKSNSIAGSCAVNALVDTRGMNTRWCVFTTSSIIDAQIYCDSLIQGETQSEGNILCSGHPALVEYKHLTGSGRLLFP